MDTDRIKKFSEFFEIFGLDSRFGTLIVTYFLKSQKGLPRVDKSLVISGYRVKWNVSLTSESNVNIHRLEVIFKKNLLSHV